MMRVSERTGVKGAREKICRRVGLKTGGAEIDDTPVTLTTPASFINLV